MAAPFAFDRTWAFDVPVEQLWGALSDTNRFPEWWSWLATDDLGPLEAGRVAQLQINPPLPYRLRLQITVERVVECERVDTLVGGDVAGPAFLEVGTDGPGGSTARLAWSLHVQRPALVAIERLLRPAMVWGHDAVIARGLQRFSAALGATATPR